MAMASEKGHVRRLPDTDADGRKSLGMTFFLLSSTMAFGGLLVLYGLLRRDAPAWPPPGGRMLPLGLAAAATASITVSSMTLHAGVRAVLRPRARLLFPWLIATLALGLTFVALELALWLDLGSGGFVPGAGNRQAGIFYVLTGFHFAHVLTAVALLLWLVPGARRERYHANDSVRVRLVARFWHFLGINWALLFVAFFVWQRG